MIESMGANCLFRDIDWKVANHGLVVDRRRLRNFTFEISKTVWKKQGVVEQNENL